MVTKKRVFSGCRPTRQLHLGNYLGGIKGYLELQNNPGFDCIYAVVDLHGIISPYNPAGFQRQIKEVVLDYLGAGLDPKKCHMLIQSQVPEHVELAYLLSTIYPVSRVEQLPTYKEKKREQPGYINVGLFYYPILMAADILLYKAEKVPVGIDQEPHLELAREVARKFNGIFARIFPEPMRFATPGESVPSLTGTGKMSKSVEGSFILLTDNLETINGKLAKVPTDSGTGKVVPRSGGVATLLALVELFEGKERRKEYEKAYLTSGLRYKSLKVSLAAAIYKELAPIQEKRSYFEKHGGEVDEILEAGRKYCAEIAGKTMSEVKEAMGLK